MDQLTFLSSLFTASANLVLGGLFLAYWLHDRRARFNLHWALSHALGMIEILLWSLQSHFHAISLLAASLSVGLSSISLVTGTALFLQRSVDWRLYGSLTAVIAVGVGVVGYLLPEDVIAVARLVHGMSCAWSGTLLLNGSDPIVRAAGSIFLVRAIELLVFAPLSLIGFAMAAFIAGHFMALATGVGLLFIGFRERSLNLEATQQQLSSRNAVLVLRERELLQSNERLGGLTRQLEETNREYAEARDQADAASSAKSRFLATMSHELRTPLNAIIGFAEMIVSSLNGKATATKELEYAGYVRDAGDHLLRIVNDLLDVANIELDTFKLHIEQASVSEMARSAAVMLHFASTKKNVAIDLDIPADLEIAVDFRLLRQVLINLIGNAIKFTPAGGRITVTAIRLGGDEIQLAVEDTGPGIEQSDREMAFEPFWQKADPMTRQQGGVGLGLSIVRRIIVAHHGTIRIEEAQGGGTAVIMTLPAVPRP